jgi:hypothetical protein
MMLLSQNSTIIAVTIQQKRPQIVKFLQMRLNFKQIRLVWAF